MDDRRQRARATWATGAPRHVRLAREGRMLRIVRRGQAAYYIVTGPWPLLSLRSFEAVTGPKADEWLPSGAAAHVRGRPRRRYRTGRPS